MTTAASPATVAVPRPETISRRRRVWIWVLVVAASVIALASILTTWVNRQMFSDSTWNKASAQVIQDPKVQSALSVYMVNTLYDNVDVAGQLQQQLPPALKGLAAPLSGALREPATNAVGFLLQRPRTQALWINASAVAHEKLVNVLENDTGNGISTGNGVVSIDVTPMIQQLGARLGIPAAALEKLPPDAGSITVLKSDQLAAAQTGVRALHVLSAWLLVLVLAMYGVAIYLARGFRRETLRNVGWAFVLVGLLVLVARRLLGNYAIDALAAAQYRDAGHHFFLIMTSILGETGRAVIIYGLVAVLGAVLAGPTDAAVAVRSRIAPVLNHRPGIAWAAVGFVYVLLILWGGTHALRVWWGILLLGALLATGVAALRRETMREFA